jgi:hypothetical protein
MTGVPIVKEATEVVRFVANQVANTVVVTDRNTYLFDPAAMPIVTYGQTVHAGEQLVDAVKIYDFRNGDPGDLPAIVLSPNMLANCVYQGLIFINEDVPLVVDTEHTSGYTYVSFKVGGNPLDVQNFFDAWHDRGIADLANFDECTGVRRGTLAHLLDRRVNVTSEPQAKHLPTTINPLRFLVENLLRYHGFAVVVNAACLGLRAAGGYNAELLQRILPPHAAVFWINNLPTLTAELVSTQVVATSAPIVACAAHVETVPTPVATPTLQWVSFNC